MSTFTEKFNHYYKNHPVTTIILLLNTLMLLITFSIGGFSLENLIKLGALRPDLISDGDYHRLVLSMFLHGNFLHFFFNNYFLYHLGGFVEKLLGKAKYITIYFISGLGSSLLVWWLSEPETVTIGASGALFGILGSLLVLTYVKTSWFTAYTIKNVRMLVVINLIFTFLFPNISVYGHLGGFATGIALVYFMVPKSPIDKDGFYYQKRQNSKSDVIEHEDIEDDDIYVH